jgi:glutathione S-transferase
LLRDAKLKAQMAIERADAILAAADARKRTGTWQAGAAPSWVDFVALSRVQNQARQAPIERRYSGRVIGIR